MKSGISIVNDQVYFGGLSITSIARKFNTPLFIFCEQRLVDNFLKLETSFKKHYSNIEIYYSIKTNFELQILKTLKKLKSNVEAASYLEVEIAIKAGFNPTQIILDGPAWTGDDMEKCIKKGIKTFNVDSLDMMKRLNEVAKKLGKKVKVSFRIYPEIKVSLLKSFIEGYIAKFGIPVSEAVEAFKVAKNMTNVEPVAISTHIGSMITDPSFYEKTIDKLIKLSKQLKEKLNIDISEINIGGGFGVQSLNYYSIQNIILNKAGISNYSKASTIEEFGRKIAKRFKSGLKQYNLPNIKLVLEPGRFLVSDTGILLTRVVSLKKDWAFIDGGINLIPESIFFIRRGFIIPTKIKEKNFKPYNIAGPTLNTADVLATKQQLPNLEVNDLVIVLDAGAYSLSRSNQFTILRPEAIYIDKAKKIKLLRKKENNFEILSKLLA